MKYENEFGTIKVLDDSKFKNKTIAVAMSGGADSTLLCYLIANTIQEQDLNITIQPYNGLDLWAPGMVNRYLKSYITLETNFHL